MIQDLLVIMLIVLLEVSVVGWFAAERKAERFRSRLQALNFLEAELESLAEPNGKEGVILKNG